MAPLYEAIASTRNAVLSRGDTDVYVGNMNADWNIGSVPNGGYVMGQIIEACIQRQISGPHPDPIHVTAHFLVATSVSSFEVHIHVLKQGKNFTNLAAELVQNNLTRVTCHLIFGVLKAEEEDALSLLPPSPYARRVPLYHHPSTAPRSAFPDRYSFHSQFTTTREPELAAQNDLDSPRRTNSKTVGGGGVHSGFWCAFKNENESVTASNLPFFADISANAPVLLPRGMRKNLALSWFPTLTMSLEYKSPIPKACRTVGIYSTTNFINNPMTRHDIYTEVWTSPSDIGEGEETEDWRDKQVCLAIATQMALVVPMAQNLAKGRL